MKKRIENRGFRVVLAAGLVVFAFIVTSDRAASETPQSPATVDPLPVLATSPQGGNHSAVVPMPYRPYLPPAVAGRDPRALPGDGQHPLNPGKAVDVPTVAGGGTRNLPPTPQMPVAPPVRVSSITSADVPVATIAAHPDRALTTLQSDPTRNVTMPSAMLWTPAPRTAAAPFLVLTIPDPSNQPGFIPERTFDHETAPISSFDRPAIRPMKVD